MSTETTDGEHQRFVDKHYKYSCKTIAEVIDELTYYHCSYRPAIIQNKEEMKDPDGKLKTSSKDLQGMEIHFWGLFDKLRELSGVRSFEQQGRDYANGLD